MPLPSQANKGTIVPESDISALDLNSDAGGEGQSPQEQLRIDY